MGLDRLAPITLTLCLMEEAMKRIMFGFDAETSDQTHTLLLEKGIEADFVRRGADGDIIAVPANQAARVRRLLDSLNV